jgi:hypothetical protein
LTNLIALWLGVVLLAAIIADMILTGGATLIFLSRKFLALVDWVVFWR